MSRLNEYNIMKKSNRFSYLLQYIFLFLLFVISINQVLGQESPNTLLRVKYFPQNNEQNINPDTQLKLIFPTPPTLGMSGKILIYEASSNTLVDSIDMSIPPGPKNSRTPAPYDKMVYKNDPWDPANGFTRANPPPVLPPSESQYQRKYIGGTKESDVYHFYPVLIDENTAIITLHQQLEYDKTYNVRVDKGIFGYMGKDSLMITHDHEWIFSTKKSPPALEVNQIVVAAENSSIKGFGDNVLGHGTVFFKNCDFISTYGPHLWVRNSKENHGNVLVDCTLRTVGNIETVIARAPGSQNYSFPYAEAVLINCKLDGISQEGWGQVGPDKSNIRYWEYNSRSLTDESPIDVSQRVNYSKQLTLKNDSLTIANYSNPSYILNGWTPSFAPIIIKQPSTNITRNGDNIEISMEAVSIPYPVYQWYKNGEIIPNEQSHMLKIDNVCSQDMGEYWVEVSNNSGTNRSEKVSLQIL